MASVAGRGWRDERLGEEGHARPGGEKRKQAAVVRPQEMGGTVIEKAVQSE